MSMWSEKGKSATLLVSSLIYSVSTIVQTYAELHALMQLVKNSPLHKTLDMHVI